jgi:LuxR family maltose regulon positive regulatory protein
VQEVPSLERRLAVGTKCSAPRLPGTLVRRSRLDDLFDADRRLRVTLVSAPAGAGKTTLLSGWSASEGGGRVGWLSLDCRDNDAYRLAGLLTAALDSAGALPGFLPPGIEPRTLLDAVFEHLMRLRRPCALLVDDLQEISSRSALGLLAHLVERAPPVLDLALASRADPPIGWVRLQVDGRLRQIRNVELSFRPDEAAELFAAHGVELAREDSRLLCERTEGWAAGLRLAACALQDDDEPHRFVLSTSATQLAVSDYLLKEVLDREDEAARQFLLRTSVADRLTPDLAVALTGDGRAGERLAALERRGLFLVELDESGSYRYHALFGTLLRARLRLQDSELFTELYDRAAHWHLANEMPAEAEEHARAAGNWALVGRLMLARWLDAELDGRHLPEEVLAGLRPPLALRVPELALILAAEACRRGRRTDTDLYRDALIEAERLRPETVAESGEPADAATWRVARLMLDLSYGRAFGDESGTRAAVATLEARPASDVWTLRARQIAVLRGAELELDAGRIDRAREHLDDLAHGAGCGWVGVEAGALLGLLDAAAGDVRGAEDRAGRALVAESDVRDDAAGIAHLAAALCAAQRGESRSVHDALAATEASGSSPAWTTVGSIERLVSAAARSRSPIGPGLEADVLDTALVQRVLVALGALEVVDVSGRPVPVGGEGERAVAEARRCVHAGDGRRSPLTAGRWLERSSTGRDSAGTPWHPRTVIEARLLAAILGDGSGDEFRVVRHLDAALGLSAATGIRAPFDDHAARVGPLIERHLVDLGAHAGLAVELVDRLSGGGGVAVLVEPLTGREREVLTYLPTLMSNVEIAEGMHLSVNTVKTHLKAIYRKLGVDGRRQAVLRGRELELL